MVEPCANCLIVGLEKFSFHPGKITPIEQIWMCLEIVAGERRNIASGCVLEGGGWKHHKQGMQTFADSVSICAPTGCGISMHKKRQVPTATGDQLKTSYFTQGVNPHCRTVVGSPNLIDWRTKFLRKAAAPSFCNSLLRGGHATNDDITLEPKLPRWQKVGGDLLICELDSERYTASGCTSWLDSRWRAIWSHALVRTRRRRRHSAADNFWRSANLSLRQKIPTPSYTTQCVMHLTLSVFHLLALSDFSPTIALLISCSCDLGHVVGLYEVSPALGYILSGVFEATT